MNELKHGQFLVRNILASSRSSYSTVVIHSRSTLPLAYLRSYLTPNRW